MTICRRELIGYFSTPIAYVFIVIFLAAMGAFTFFLGGFFTQGQATLESFFQFHPWLYLFLIPAISMRLWAEERKSGSIELLLTLPVSTSSAVLGKFLAAWAVAASGLLLTATIWLTVNYLGSPDNAAIAAGYLGSFFMAGGYLANRCLRLRDDQEPGHRIHRHCRTVLSLHRKRTERRARVLQRLGTACGTGRGRQLQLSRALSAGLARGRRLARCRVLHFHDRVLPCSPTSSQSNTGKMPERKGVR